MRKGIILLYIFLVCLLFIYAAGHMVYTFSYEGLQSAEAKMWFFSAGLAMLFNGLLNLVYLKSRTNEAKTPVVVSNSVLLLYLIVLSAVIPEIQVFIFALIVLATLVVSCRFSLGR